MNPSSEPVITSASVEELISSETPLMLCSPHGFVGCGFRISTVVDIFHSEPSRLPNQIETNPFACPTARIMDDPNTTESPLLATPSALGYWSTALLLRSHHVPLRLDQSTSDES